MQLEDTQTVIALLVAGDETQSVLTATENGYGKRTPITEYTRHGRGTGGMIAIQTSSRNGKVVGAVLVMPSDEIMLITTGGVLVRTRVAEIREMGRATQGVTLINVDDGSSLSGVRRVVESDADDDSDLDENGQDAGDEGGDATDRRNLRSNDGPPLELLGWPLGPAEVVLRQAAAEMLDWNGSGMSVMEMSHRGKHFVQICDEAESDLRELLSLPADYAVMFAQGGGSGKTPSFP